MAFLVEADQFAWLLPFAVMSLPAYLAFFTGFGAADRALSVEHRDRAAFLLSRSASESPNGCADMC